MSTLVSYNLGRLPWASPFEASVAGVFAAMCLGKHWTCCSTWVHSNAPHLLETHLQFWHDKHRFQSKAKWVNELHTVVHAQQVSKVEKLKNERNWRTNHANGSSLGCQVDLWKFSCSEMFASICSTGWRHPCCLDLGAYVRVWLSWSFQFWWRFMQFHFSEVLKWFTTAPLANAWDLGSVPTFPWLPMPVSRCARGVEVVEITSKLLRMCLKAASK